MLTVPYICKSAWPRAFCRRMDLCGRMTRRCVTSCQGFLLKMKLDLWQYSLNITEQLSMAEYFSVHPGFQSLESGSQVASSFDAKQEVFHL